MAFLRRRLLNGFRSCHLGSEVPHEYIEGSATMGEDASPASGQVAAPQGTGKGKETAPRHPDTVDTSDNLLSRVSN